MRSFERCKLFFNELEHKYTDNRGVTYTSMTTVLGKYEHPFETDKVALATSRKYWNAVGHKYYRMTPKKIKELWAEINTTACDKGNKKHNYFETSIKTANGYNRRAGGIYINDYIYTLDDILDDHDYGLVDLKHFRNTKIDIRYPSIYNALEYHISNGWKIYAEVGVYNPDLVVSGLIDVLMVKGNLFRILDWKTNKRKMEFNAGYFKRDQFGEETEEYVYTPNKKLKPPLDNIEHCNGQEYSLQLSGYAYLTEQFGLTCDGLFLAHIRDIKDKQTGKEKEVVEFHNIKYLKKDVLKMFNHHNRIYNQSQQQTLIF